MKYRLVLKEEFISDFAEAMNWYEQRKKGLADELYKDASTILLHIESHPESFSVTTKKYRQALLKRFPYFIVYKIYGSEIAAYALFHTARNPRKKLRRK